MNIIPAVAYSYDALDALEDMCRQHCHPAGDNTTLIDSGFLSANAEGLRTLAKYGRFLVEKDEGRYVCGYWPDEEKK